MTAAPGVIDAATLKAWLADGGEIALLDVREAGQFGEGHIFQAVPLPYSRFELDLPRLAPRPSVRLVLADDGDDVARRAAQRALSLGYGDVWILRGGVRSWQDAGHRLFAGVNVASKAFGELVEHEFATPSVTAEELQARLQRGDDLIVVDGRPVEEYRRMSIPGAVCCPNGELACRIAELAPSPATTVVVNCAGRTRSIIGAQTLRHLGITNPVLALRNGTMGWRLAGLALEQGADRLYPAELPPARIAALRDQAVATAARLGVRLLDPAQARDWLHRPSRTTCLLDVRTREEFVHGHAPGAVHAPGGQLIQATDQWLAVRNGAVILLDDLRLRAVMVAHWLQLMGWDVAVLDAGVDGWAALGDGPPVPALDHAAPALDRIAPAELRAMPQPPAILDLRPSMDYRAGHVRGARWAIRPRAANAVAAIAGISGSSPIVLAAADPDVARLFASELPAADLSRTRLLEGGVEDWRKAGLDIVATPDMPADQDCIDFLFFVHDRHTGNLDSARRYLAWETGLVEQLDPDERASFRLG